MARSRIERRVLLGGRVEEPADLVLVDGLGQPSGRRTGRTSAVGSAGGAALFEQEPVQASQRGQGPRHRRRAEPGRRAASARCSSTVGHVGVVHRASRAGQEGLVVDAGRAGTR